MADPRIEGRRVSYGHVSTMFGYLLMWFLWSTTIVNVSFNLQEEKEQCDYFCRIDPEWDERSYVVMVKLMKKKAKAEEDAK
jgi:hypothetical protein